MATIDTKLLSLLRSKLIISPCFVNYKKTYCRLFVFPPVEKSFTSVSLENSYEVILRFLFSLVPENSSTLVVIDMRGSNWNIHGKSVIKTLQIYELKIKHCYILASSSILQRVKTSLIPILKSKNQPYEITTLPCESFPKALSEHCLETLSQITE